MARASVLFSGSGPLLGAPAPKHKTGRVYPPPYYASDGTDLTTTSTRLYYMPCLITEIRQYAGFVMRNSGSGDSGEKCRLGLYADNNGVPGTLVQAATEITFAGAAADNSTSNPFTPTTLGWYWLAAHFDSASTVKRMIGAGMQITAASYFPPVILPAFHGYFALANFNLADAANAAAYYVDTTYAALASTAVAPTATTSVAPAVALIA